MYTTSNVLHQSQTQCEQQPTLAYRNALHKKQYLGPTGVILTNQPQNMSTKFPIKNAGKILNWLVRTTLSLLRPYSRDFL